MLAKHALIVMMALLGIWLQYGVAPALERVSLLLEKSKGDPVTWERLRLQEVRLTIAISALGVGVLACSAWAGVL